MVKIIRRMLTSVLITAGAGFVIYKVVLDENAQAEVKNVANTIRDSYQQISEVVEDITGIVIEEDAQELPNKADTMKQWEELGF